MPAAKLIRLSGRRLARKIGAYVNDRWEGNVSEAAREMGVDGKALRAQAVGTAVRPNVEISRALAKHSGEPLDAWL